MKSSVLCFAVVLAFAAFLHSSDAQAEEQCASHLCLPSNQCASFAQSGYCPNREHSCCREVRREFRSQCRHFGGECVTHRCNQRLIAREAQDCRSNEVCCILIN
ncbi:uncharacterized protein LOC107047034 [Diachasma alloeum]|uniref:uncharacterized protein LOC107047034 n=1 Tax=Diachasma alloeum TaxID=454923 RepID=UPI000738376C|nr:uncharacterized protein LOC107047034 [Diachasma alloeum]